jgi:hypothetical protein
VWPLGRPFRYFQEKVRKEELARQIAERDHIEDGLICVLSVLEPCRTFSFRSEKGKPFVASARRKCLFLYYYFMDRDFGLIHVKLQTWFPLQIQMYVNGHEWLARKLKENSVAGDGKECIRKERVMTRIMAGQNSANPSIVILFLSSAWLPKRPNR